MYELEHAFQLSRVFDVQGRGDLCPELLCKRFDVIRMKNMYGKQVRGIERSTFVIDREGRLAREWRKVSVPGHAHEVLDFVKTL